MKLDVMLAGRPLREAAALARAAETAGLDGIVVTEAGRSAYTTCTAVALSADLHVSTGIAAAFARSPMVNAQAAWELAEATAGKFRLGLGTQVKAHIERRYGAAFEHPGPRLADHVEAVRACFRAFSGDEPLAHAGPFYTLSLLPPAWSPGPTGYPDPPIDVAAVNPWMLRMAATLADGVHLHPLTTPTYLTETVGPALASGLTASGRSRSDLNVTAPCFAAAGDSAEDRRAWRELARMQVAFYGSTPNYSFLFEQLGRPDTTSRLRQHQKAGDAAAMAEVVDDELLAHFLVEATWDDMPAALTARYGGWADRVVLYFAALEWDRDPGRLARWGEVAAALAQAWDGHGSGTVAPTANEPL